LNGIAALVFGRMFDRYGVRVLAIAIILSMFALPLGFLAGPPGAIAAVACWAIGLGAQQATLRAGIAQLVSMNKRGNAYGVFNAAYGVCWFAGSVAMGLLYDYSLMALVIFGVALQLIAAATFWWLHGRLKLATGN
jgi:predicted MFS family arabinose efflux permease